MTRTETNFRLLNETILENIEVLLDYFDITYSVLPNRISCSCPLHNSSRDNSCSIFTNGLGNYVCWTRHCESVYGKYPINFIHGLMRREVNSTRLPDAIKLISDITKKDFSTPVSINKETLIFNSFNKEEKIRQNNILCSRDYVLKTLRMPCEYFINRGFSEKTLRKFDVGLSCIKQNDMYMRAVVPVYDDSGTNMIGCLGRSIYEECPICELYHNKDSKCPSSGIEYKNASKWINSKNFVSGSCLYNIWRAKEFCRKTDNLHLVEGTGDVWKMSEAGYDDCVSIFGCNFTDQHFRIIETLGITNITIILDNDDAGKVAQEKIVKKLSMYYNIKQPILTEKDLGSTPIEKIKEIIECTY